MTSIVRENLLTEPNYTPYCGAKTCPCRWPRTRFNGQQFECVCGWKSNFEKDFIKKYKHFNSTPTGRTPSPPNIQNIPGTLASALDKIQERSGMAFNDPYWPDDMGESNNDEEGL